MSKTPSLSAGTVLNVLAEKHFKAPAHEMLREVRNGTGYGGRQERYADGIVVSCWPSRGVWFGGIEVKVSRADWKRELDDPHKSAEIQRFCSYWWVATPEGIVKPGELPETWGHLEVSEKSARVAKEAPRLDAQPPTPTFVASILRNASAAEASRKQTEYNRGYREAFAEFGGDDKQELVRAAEIAKRAESEATKRLNELQLLVSAFERDTGVAISGWRASAAAGEFRSARAASEALRLADLGRMANTLRGAAEALSQAQDELRAAQSREAAE